MSTEKTTSMYRWVRRLHRDIGFFAVGLTVIYCISGIMLTYRDTGFLKSEKEIVRQVEPGLQADQLGRMLHLRNFKIVEESEQEILFNNGTYNKQSGVVSYVGQELPALLNTFNKLHTASSSDSRHWFTVLYAVMLSFLAISSFWMFRPSCRLFTRGIIFSFAGLCVACLLLIL